MRLSIHGKAAAIALAAGVLACATQGRASEEFRSSGKLLLTGGVTSVEGSAGGGLASWAVIGGYETRDGIGAGANATEVRVSDFELRTIGAHVGFYDRLELSYTRQRFDTLDAGAALGLGKGFAVNQDVFGAKARLFGNVVYDQDTWRPQVSVGIQYKHNDQRGLVHALGATSNDGVDYYIAASKLFLAQSLLLNATVRATKANQFGILGFGGDRDRDYSAQFEGSAAYLLTRRFVVGVEGRTKPDNLGFARERGTYDVFGAYAFSKAVSLTVAYVDLGRSPPSRTQPGVYASLQAGF